MTACESSRWWRAMGNNPTRAERKFGGFRHLAMTAAKMGDLS